jgi:hypothetical protein
MLTLSIPRYFLEKGRQSRALLAPEGKDKGISKIRKAGGREG